MKLFYLATTSAVLCLLPLYLSFSTVSLVETKRKQEIEIEKNLRTIDSLNSIILRKSDMELIVEPVDKMKKSN